MTPPWDTPNVPLSILAFVAGVVLGLLGALRKERP